MKTLRSTAIRGLKFYLVGAAGILVQLFALTTLKSVAGLELSVATALAVEIAVLHNFFWHERFTWSDRSCDSRRHVLHRLLRFNLTTGALSILGNLIFMRALVTRLHLHLLVANLISIGLCSLLNFVVSDQMVFRRLETEPEGDY